MAGLESYRVQDIRSALVYLGLPKEEADEIKGKSSLVEKLTAMCDEGDYDVAKVMEFVVTGDVSDDEDSEEEAIPEDGFEGDFSETEFDPEGLLPPSKEDVEEGEKGFESPRYGESDWSDYVMTKFTESELVDGNPTVGGLRRVAENLLGRVLFSGPVDIKVHYPLNPHEVGRATCTYQVQIEWKMDAGLYYMEEDEIAPPTRVFTAVGGSYLGNTDDEFAIYPEAMAETRAESRALRKALGLNKVSHDELTRKSPMESINASKVEEVGSEWSADDKLQESQKLHIVAKCKSLGIDVNKFINLKYHMGQEDAPTYKSIDDVPRGVAGKMVKVLSEYQSETGDNESRNVPEVIMLENE